MEAVGTVHARNLLDEIAQLIDDDRVELNRIWILLVRVGSVGQRDDLSDFVEDGSTSWAMMPQIRGAGSIMLALALHVIGFLNLFIALAFSHGDNSFQLLLEDIDYPLYQPVLPLLGQFRFGSFDTDGCFSGYHFFVEPERLHETFACPRRTGVN